MRGACSTHEMDEKWIQSLGGNPRRKRQQGRLRCRWKDNIKIDVTEIG